jgi:hypothetical protein
MAIRDFNEADLVQNAGLGGVLLWRFALGFQGDAYAPTPVPLLFLVLPVCFHQTSLESAIRTRKNSGLALFASRLGEVREDLLAVHTRALAFRQLTIDSVSVAIKAHLFTIDYRQATVRASARATPDMSEHVKPLWVAAKKLGHWCGDLSLSQTALLLKVNF